LPLSFARDVAMFMKVTFFKKKCLIDHPRRKMRFFRNQMNNFQKRRTIMKQITKWVVFIITLFFISDGQAMTPNGACQSFTNSSQTQGQIPNEFCGRPCRLIVNGEKLTISGTVSEALYAGQGLTVDTGLELVTIYGFGPQWYWDLLGVDKPDVGEEVEIEAVKVTFCDGTEKIIAIAVTIGDDVVQLRDDNGRPLWRCKGRPS
jgi:hypothetical protein